MDRNSSLKHLLPAGALLAGTAGVTGLACGQPWAVVPISVGFALAGAAYVHASMAPKPDPRKMRRRATDFLLSRNHSEAAQLAPDQIDVATADPNVKVRYVKLTAEAAGGRVPNDRRQSESDKSGAVDSILIATGQGVDAPEFKVVTNPDFDPQIFRDLSKQLMVAASETEEAVSGAIGAFFQVSAKASSLSEKAIKNFEGADGQRVRKASELASEVVSDLVDRMREDAEAMALASKASLELRSISHDLEGLLDEIDKVADQTSMLALNAQIEAARAGSGGRAFMIVAEEVRKLSSRSRAAAERTRDLSQQMAEASEITAVKLKEAAEQALEGAGKAEVEVSQMLSAIRESDEVTAATLEQLTNESREIGDQIGRITTALQFQDMLRQRLEHVAVPLDNMAEGHPVDFRSTDGSGSHEAGFSNLAAGRAPDLQVVHYGTTDSAAEVTLF